MASPVDIANLALAHLGQAPSISSFDPPEDSAEAQHAARFYPIARDSLLELHSWGFATKRIALSALVTNPVDTFAFAYGKPADCLKPVAVLMPQQASAVAAWFDGWRPFVSLPPDLVRWPFIVEAKQDGTVFIATDVEDAILLYTAAVTDSVKFSPLFVRALSYLLASDLAGPITKSPEMKTTMYNAALTALGMAATSDANAQQNNAYTEFVPAGIAARR